MARKSGVTSLLFPLDSMVNKLDENMTELEKTARIAL